MFTTIKKGLVYVFAKMIMGLIMAVVYIYLGIWFVVKHVRKAFVILFDPDEFDKVLDKWYEKAESMIKGSEV